MKLFAAIALCLPATCGAADSPAHVHDVASLPDAPEKALVQEYCVGCHQISRIEHAGGTFEGWSDRVRRMIRWGAKIPMDQVGTLAAYLAKALPPRLRPPSESAAPLNTAVSTASLRDVQTTLRLAGELDATGKIVTASVTPADAALIKQGQRARAFALQSRSSMYQGRIVRVVTLAGRTQVESVLSTRATDPHSNYLMEVVTERGWFLSVPNEAIIEEDGRQVVYVQQRSGDYEPREIQTGVQGDLYTQVVAGLTAGEDVVTLGSFFIDSEYKMKVAGP